MKVFAGFVIGIIFCLATVWAVGYFTIDANADDTTTTTGEPDLASLLPDIGKIYRNALGSPYRQVRAEITDPELAAFWDRYMAETGLDQAGLEETP